MEYLSLILNMLQFSPDALIRAEPQIAKEFGVSGKTCLHLACLYSMDSDLFRELLELWPEATKWKDRDGWHA